MKIVIDNAIPYIKGRFGGNVKDVYLPGKEITAEDVRDADTLIVRTRTLCDRNLLEDSKVKLISTATIGTDHIDMDWCDEKGITVKNAPGCNAPGVAQYVFASILRMGFDPKKDTLGVIGHGNVGNTVSGWAKEMGIKTMISDAPKQEAGFDDVEYRSQEEVLKECRFVTLHVPYTTDGPFPTHDLIGENDLTLMKPDSVLINTSRGGVVNEKAWKKVLEKGGRRAVIDVWGNEPEIDHELVTLATIATPHIAGYSLEGKKRATRMTLVNVREKFGIDVDLKGLDCTPPEDLKITPQLICRSYDPETDSNKLKNDIAEFENLRNRYEYRHEPQFS